MKKTIDYRAKLIHLFEALNHVTLSDANLSLNKQVEGVEQLNTTTVNTNKADGIFDDPYAQEANISINPDGTGNPNPALPENEVDKMNNFVKREVRYLRIGDVLFGSGAKIIQAPVSGLKTPTGKIEIGVEYPNGVKKLQLWGKYTIVAVVPRIEPKIDSSVPPVVEDRGAGNVNDKLPDEITNNYTPSIGLGSGLGESEDSNTDYNEGTPTDPDDDNITKPRIGESESPELIFKPKEGFWDVTKYPYGGHFGRFTGGEKGNLIKGTVKMGDEIRVQLENGRTVICRAAAVANMDTDTVYELADKLGRVIV